MTEGAGVAARAMLDRLVTRPAWAVIRLRDSADGHAGRRQPAPRCERLADIPLEEGVPESGRRFDRLVAVPFRQVTERGFEAHDDGTPLAVVDDRAPRRRSRSPTWSRRCPTSRSSSRTAAASRPPTRTTPPSSTGSSATRSATARAPTSWSAATTAPSCATGTPTGRSPCCGGCSSSERGAYWTYCFWTGDRFLIGASPERHVSVHGGDVRMNPISGTFRLPRAGRLERPSARPGCWSSSPTRRRSTSSSWSSTRS